MTLTSRIEFLDPALIVVSREARQRQETLDISDLLPSIERRGVIHPILINSALELIAGERRLLCCKKLGVLVPCRFAEDIGTIEHQLIEAEENFKRKDLSWQEQVRAVAKIHALFCTTDPDWTMAETAEAISLSLGTVSMYLSVNAELSGDGRLEEAGTVREAYNTIKRKEARQAGNELEELLTMGSPEEPTLFETLVESALPAGPFPAPVAEAPAPPSPLPNSPELCIQHLSFLDWAQSYSGKKFNLIHCDFPFGANMFGGEQGRGAERSEDYSDEKEVYFELLDCFCKNFENFASFSCHVMFWLSFPHFEATRAMFRNHLPSLEMVRHPLIWHKTDNAGIIADARRDPRHVYEMALLFRRGGRNVVKSTADAYGAPSDRTLHQSTKPEPMLRHFFSMLCDEYTDLLDPTCGAGSALRAAESLGARSILGLEIDKGHVRLARQALANARALREANSRLEL